MRLRENTYVYSIFTLTVSVHSIALSSGFLEIISSAAAFVTWLGFEAGVAAFGLNNLAFWLSMIIINDMVNISTTWHNALIQN